MEASHVFHQVFKHVLEHRDRRATPPALASALQALRRVPATNTRLWLARSASAPTARALGLVLLDALPALLLAPRAEVVGHG